MKSESLHESQLDHLGPFRVQLQGKQRAYHLGDPPLAFGLSWWSHSLTRCEGEQITPASRWGGRRGEEREYREGKKRWDESTSFLIAGQRCFFPFIFSLFHCLSYWPRAWEPSGAAKASCSRFNTISLTGDKWPFLYLEHEETWEWYAHDSNLPSHTSTRSVLIVFCCLLSGGKTLASTYLKASLCQRCLMA